MSANAERAPIVDSAAQRRLWPRSSLQPGPGRADIDLQMILVAVFLLSLLSVPLAGGRLGRLAEVRLRAGWLALAALAVQVLIITVAPQGSHPLHVAVHIGTYLAAAAFLAANWRLPFLPVVAIGGAMNFVAIAANGGVMPASRGALATAGLLPDAGHFYNSAAVADPRLGFLGDVFATPASWPLANVFSVGDVLIALGAALAVHALAGSRLAELRPRGRSPAPRR